MIETVRVVLVPHTPSIRRGKQVWRDFYSEASEHFYEDKINETEDARGQKVFIVDGVKYF